MRTSRDPHGDLKNNISLSLTILSNVMPSSVIRDDSEESSGDGRITVTQSRCKCPKILPPSVRDQLLLGQSGLGLMLVGSRSRGSESVPH